MAQSWDRLARQYWPDLQVDCVGQLVRGGDVEVVFSVRRRGLQFRAGSLADVKRYMGPRPEAAPERRHSFRQRKESGETVQQMLF